MSNDPDAHEDERPTFIVDCDAGEVKTLIGNALGRAGWQVDHIATGFDEEAFRRAMGRAEELASILADMLRPQPLSNVRDEEIPF